MIATLALVMLVQGQPETGKIYSTDIEKPQTKYWCQLPDGYTADRQWPVMVILHGAGDTAENFIQFWAAGGSKAKFILAAAK